MIGNVQLNLVPVEFGRIILNGIQLCCCFNGLFGLATGKGRGQCRSFGTALKRNYEELWKLILICQFIRFLLFKKKIFNFKTRGFVIIYLISVLNEDWLYYSHVPIPLQVNLISIKSELS